jgi:hypothetical protein
MLHPYNAKLTQFTPVRSEELHIIYRPTTIENSHLSPSSTEHVHGSRSMVIVRHWRVECLGEIGDMTMSLKSLTCFDPWHWWWFYYELLLFLCVKHVFQFTLKTISAYLCTRPFVFAMLDIYTNTITLFLDVTTTTTKWGEKHMFHTRGTTSSYTRLSRRQLLKPWASSTQL